MKQYRLDELYKMTAHIYSEQNFTRSIEATFLHFVEVCGMLTILARKKSRTGITFEDSLCKALGWFFPLMAKCEIESVEDLIFRKFPTVCPYCRQSPHVDRNCKVVIGDAAVNHDALKQAYEDNIHLIPLTLNGWADMFDKIYPRQPDERNKSAIGLMEELGELAEAIRVRKLHPKFLAGEAADVFSYLMGLANEFSISREMECGERLDLNYEFISRYPGLCPACGDFICSCPSVPPATIGRMSKELDIEDGTSIFTHDAKLFNSQGSDICRDVLHNFGGLEKLSASLPMDRGQVHSSLVIVAIRLSEQLVEIGFLDEGSQLRQLAISHSKKQKGPGDKLSRTGNPDIIAAINSGIRAIVERKQKPHLDLEGGPADVLASGVLTTRVLVIFCSPLYESKLNLEKEQRVLEESIQKASGLIRIEVDFVRDATVDDFRRKMLSGDYNIVHFSCHGSNKSIVLQDSEGQAQEVTLASLRKYFTNFGGEQLIILNSCNSLQDEVDPIGCFCIGMENSVDDNSAIEFARGFYDGISNGLDFERSIREGIHCVELKGLPEIPLIKLGFTKQSA